MENNKKILIIGAVLIVSGLAFYFVTKKKKVVEIPLVKPDETTNTSNNPPNNTSSNSTSGNSNNSSTTSGTPKIVINSAFYGERDNQLDVKKNIENIIAVGLYQFRATNNFFGKDPSPRNPKYLLMDYSIDGITVPLAVFNSETPNFRADIDGVREGNLVTLYKKP
jgi:LPXTG-motif cell wall-anchored protein